MLSSSGILITLLKDKQKTIKHKIIVHIFLLPHCLIYIGRVYTEILLIVPARIIELRNTASMDLLDVIQFGLCPCDIRNSILGNNND
jgi:hypothetical protein